MNKQLDEVLICYLQLCEAFCYSNIWEDRDAIAQYHYNKKDMENDSPVLMLYEHIFNASILYRKILNGESEVEDCYDDIHWIADKVWYATQRADVSSLTNDNNVDIEKTVTDRLIKYFNLQYHTIDRTFLHHVSGEVWDALGGDN